MLFKPFASLVRPTYERESKKGDLELIFAWENRAKHNTMVKDTGELESSTGIVCSRSDNYRNDPGNVLHYSFWSIGAVTKLLLCLALARATRTSTSG